MPEKLSQGPRIGYDARVSAGLSRGPNLKKTLPAAAWAGAWPAPGSTLDLDFENNRGWVRGSGQGGVMDALTFTRASNATYVGSDGLLKGYTQGGNNTFAFPQDFDNAVWGKTNVTVSANVSVAPDGTRTADFMAASASSGTHGVSQQGPSLSSGQVASISIYAKNGGYRYFMLAHSFGMGGSTPFVVFDFETETFVTNTNPSYATPSFVAGGDGWYRLIVTFTSEYSGSRGVSFLTTNNATSGSFLGDGSSGVLIWGAQIELGSTATTYYPTNVAVPRFDWASTATVVEGQNLISNSEIFATGWTVNSGSITDNSETSPAGTLTAALHNGASYKGYSYDINKSYTISIYAKSKTASLFKLGTAYGIAARFDLSNGTVVESGIYSASIYDAGGGWYRCVVSFSAGTSVQNYVAIQIVDGGDIAVWGLQVEYGSTASSYKAVGAHPVATTPLAATPTCNGLLIEEARTNRILWCRDATDASWVKTDVTAAKDQTGIDGVANAASSLTATADGGTCVQTITLASGLRTGSAYLKRIELLPDPWTDSRLA